jgi:hypothetical protein
MKTQKYLNVMGRFHFFQSKARQPENQHHRTSHDAQPLHIPLKIK